MYVRMYVCTYVCMYVHMYVCTYVCMYACIPCPGPVDAPVYLLQLQACSFDHPDYYNNIYAYKCNILHSSAVKYAKTNCLNKSDFDQIFM